MTNELPPGSEGQVPDRGIELDFPLSPTDVEDHFLALSDYFFDPTQEVPEPLIKAEEQLAQDLGFNDFLKEMRETMNQRAPREYDLIYLRWGHFLAYSLFMHAAFPKTLPPGSLEARRQIRSFTTREVEVTQNNQTRLGIALNRPGINLLVQNLLHREPTIQHEFENLEDRINTSQMRTRNSMLGSLKAGVAQVYIALRHDLGKKGIS